VAWYGVRLFTDGWTPERAATDPEDLVLEAELIASQRDPYRRLSRLFHLMGRRPDLPDCPETPAQGHPEAPIWRMLRR
jgi:hypothetical protein